MNLITGEEGITTGTFIFTFTDSEGIREINRQFLNRDRDTNVITFSYINDFSPEISPVIAEIFINTDRVFSEAEEAGITPEERFWQLVIHGILHGLDYEHEGVPEEVRREMETRETRYYNLWKREEDDKG